MKTPYIAGRIQPKTVPATRTDDARVQELRTARVCDRINYRNDLKKLAEEYEEKLGNEFRLRSAMVAAHADQLQRQRWTWGFLCFLFLIAGMVLGDALAPYSLR